MQANFSIVINLVQLGITIAKTGVSAALCSKIENGRNGRNSSQNERTIEVLKAAKGKMTF